MRISGRSGRTIISLDEITLQISITADDEEWTWTAGYRPCLKLANEETVYFDQAPLIRHTPVENGVGCGIRSRYEGLTGIPAFETYVWVEDASEDVYFEWIPLREDGRGEDEAAPLPDVASPNPFVPRPDTVKCVLWPGPMAFEKKRTDWYTLLNEGQGLLIPNDWKEGIKELHFDGMYMTAGSYMPWYGQVRASCGYLAIALTPWNGRVQADHPANGPYTHIWTQWDPSLGRMSDRRVMRYSFRKNTDYNDLCRIYRAYVFENGLAATLREKEVRLPGLKKLAGAEFVHMGIKTHVNPQSDFFDPENPEKNNSLVTFEQRRQEIGRLHDMGVKNLYLHLDGWAEPGYDNCHPDYIPACKEAGGWEGLKNLVDSVHAWEYEIGLHDQYRDFYKNAPSFDEDYACISMDGTIPQHNRWAGGPQEYLSATEAVYYVKRNYQEVFSHGIHPDCTYLDVFTCNEGDECANPRHRMTRRDCLQGREQCFRWMTAHGVIPSSEEVSDWAMNSLVFCHYAPYYFQLQQPDAPQKGVPVPLFNLVYHDCVITPWIMDKQDDQPDQMLYALLNGGAPYLIRNGAYPNIDGTYDGGVSYTLQQKISRSDAVAKIHKKVAFEQMTRHEFLGDWKRQRTVFSDGTEVMIDLENECYEIKLERGETLCPSIKTNIILENIT